MSLQDRIKEHGFDSDSDTPEELDGESLSWSECLTTPSYWCKQLGVIWRQTLVFLSLNFKDIASRKVNFCLGLMSCFIVVTVTALMLTVLVQLPVLFLKLGELSEGQIDFRVTTGGDAFEAQSLNYTKVKTSQLFQSGTYSFHSPRIEFVANQGLRANNIKTCNFSQLSDVWNTSKAAAQTVYTTPSSCETTSCVSAFCPLDRQSFVVPHWIWIDTLRERRAGIGSDFPTSFGSNNNGTIPPGTVILDQGAAGILNVSVNDTVLLSGNVIGRLLEAFIQAELIDLSDSPYSTWRHMAMPVTVLAIIDDTYSKVATDDTPLIISEYASTLAYMSSYFAPNVSSSATLRAALAKANPDEFATTVLFNYPPSMRFAAYTHSDYAKTLASATSFAGPIVTSLGFNQIDISVPIVEFMNGTRFFALFLGLIVSIIIVGLGALSIVLVYSLLMVGIQTRQFELGVMRMVGFTRTNLVMYIVTGASLFAIPALVLGLITAQLVFLGVRGVMQSALGVLLPPELTPTGVGLGVVAGLAIPLLASISPILDVLALSLPDALNTQRSRVQAIIYDIRTDAERPLNWTLILFGAALVVFGFLIYYLFPLSLFTFNLTLLFYIFFALLLGMLFGFILLAMNFDHFAQTLVVYVFFFVEKEAIFKLVRSNLVAHRQRNRSNSLMFAVAVGFIVFITVAFDIQIQSVKYNAARSAGGELEIKPEGRNYDAYNYISFTQMTQIDSHLRTIRRNLYPGLRWTWCGLDMDDMPRIPNTTMETLGRFKTFSTIQLDHASPNFFEVADPSYLIVHSELPKSQTGGRTFSEYLYTREGSGRAIIGRYVMEQFAISDQDDFSGQNDMFQFVVTRPGLNSTEEDLRSLAAPNAVLDASPVKRFSKFPSRFAQPALISVPSFMQRANGSVVSVQDLKFSHIAVQCSRSEAERIAASLAQSRIKFNRIEVRKLADRESNLNVAQTIVGFFFAFTQAVAMSVCFFALISTMSTNIYEHAKEIGIMRSIGAYSSYVTRMFIEEAFVLVFAACLLGTIVGTAVAYTMLLQRALFTQLPLPFSFPAANVVLMFLLSIVFAFFSTWGPIKAVLNMPSITHILRRSA